MKSVIITSHSVGNNSYSLDNLDFDIISKRKNTFSENEIKDFSKPILQTYHAGDALICGEALKTFHENGLSTSLLAYEAQLQGYFITIEFHNEKPQKLVFFDKKLADEAYVALSAVVEPTQKALDKFEVAFDNKGYFIERGFDPYRKQEDNQKYMKMWNSLFDKSGNVKDAITFQDFEKFIEKYHCSPFSDIVKLYYAQIHGVATKDSYPAIYMWR
jgi:hypothetical protein